MFHIAKQESLEHIITVTKALRQQQDLLANCFLSKIRCLSRISVQQRTGAGGSISAAAWHGLSCRRIALSRGLPLAILMRSPPLASTVQSFLPGWGLWDVLGVGGTWSIHVCVWVLWCRSLMLYCRFWRAVSTVLTDKGAAWKMRSVELPSEAGAQPGNSIPLSFHPLNLTAAQLSAAVPLSLSIHLHVKQQMIAGNCTILSSSSRILLTTLLNQAFPHCCGDAGRCPALSDFKPALDFWESVKIQGGRHGPSLFLAPPFSCWASLCALSPVWQCWIWEGQNPGVNPGSCKGWGEWGWPNSLWLSSREYRWWKQNAFSALAF